MSSSVSDWLDVVPWLARAIDSTRYEVAIVRNKQEQDVILQHLVSRLQSSVQYYAEAALPPPPYELEGALFLDGERRTMRKDAWGLFLDNFNRPERFFLQVCLPEAEHNLRVYSSPEDIQRSTLASAVALELAFQTPYQPSQKSRFLTALETYEQMYDPQIHHRRIIPIVQSSACGKSRLVKELSSEDYVISICLRNDRNPASGWPPGDVGVLRFFKTYGGGKYKGEELAAAFLGALAHVVADSISIPSSSSSEAPPKDSLASWKYTLPTSNASSLDTTMDTNNRESHIAKIISRTKHVT